MVPARVFSPIQTGVMPAGVKNRMGHRTR